MTDRRRPAAASRILAAGGSVAATMALVAAMAAGPDAAPPIEVAATPGQTLRVVITDPRIDPATAVAAARRAAAAGQTSISVPVGGVRAASSTGAAGAPHTATRSS